MFIDVSLFLLFVVSAVGLWYNLYQKIPLVISIPEEVIVEEIRKDSRRLHLKFVALKTLYHEINYREFFFKKLAKLIYRFHIVLLRLDNRLVAIIYKLRNGNGVNGATQNGIYVNGLGRKEYWQNVASFKEPSQKSTVSEVKGKEGD